MDLIEDMDDLYEAYRAEPVIKPLRVAGMRLVRGIGASTPKARVMVVAGSPSATENVNGQAFSSLAGRVIRQLLSTANLRLERSPNTWGTYAVKYRLPGGRVPEIGELRAGGPYLRKEWELAGHPSLVITIGVPALQAFMGEAFQESRSYGRPIPSNGGVNVVWPMIDPRHGVRDTTVRNIIERHWEELGKWIEQKGLLG